MAPNSTGGNQDTFTLLPNPVYFMWGTDALCALAHGCSVYGGVRAAGPHKEVEVNPREGLLHVLALARARNISVGLSTWYIDDSTHRRDEMVMVGCAMRGMDLCCAARLLREARRVAAQRFLPCLERDP